MIKGLIDLASYAYWDGSLIGNMFSQWSQAGFFTYLLPFLLIFALVFGIMEKTNIFKDNKYVSGIIALVVGLLALQTDMLQRFLPEVFSRTGVGLVILLIVLIFLGIFIPKQTWVVYTLFGVSAIIVIVIFVQTAGAVGWSSGYWWSQNWAMVAGGIFILVLVAVVVGASSKTPTPVDDIAPKWMKDIWGPKV